MIDYFKKIFKTAEINYDDVISDIDNKIDNGEFNFEEIKKEIELVKFKKVKKKKSAKKIFFTSFFLAGVFLATALITTQGNSFVINDKNIKQANENVIISLCNDDEYFHQITEQNLEENIAKTEYKNTDTTKTVDTIKSKTIKTYKNGKKSFTVYLEKYNKENANITFVGPFSIGKKITVSNQKYVVLSNSKFNYFIKYNKNQIVCFCGELKEEEFIEIIKKVEEGD